MKPATFGPVYICLYPELAELTRKHGYALAIHGSVSRDFDLVCIPWIDEPSSPEDVVTDIVNTYAFERVAGDPVEHLHGRLVYTLTVSFGECFLDLSFMPIHKP